MGGNLSDEYVNQTYEVRLFSDVGMVTLFHAISMKSTENALSRDAFACRGN